MSFEGIGVLGLVRKAGMRNEGRNKYFILANGLSPRVMPKVGKL